MLKQSAIALWSFAFFSVAASQLGFAYTDEEVAKAKQFIEEKFSPEKKALLQELAKKAGKSPEELFLDISKIGGENFLGEHPDEPEDPPAPNANTDSENQPAPKE